ncbi:glycogen synthase [Actinomadura fibrosa]|uniref:Glycogen synthase n=1 Tax=Actinomadura fibrosa TaxID=111802 RepID=A0ABW2XWP8_9ACTN|nr:glycogen synthase [Actinomadura fibrosa]
MRVDLLTREYPPDVYGGVGVHVARLVPRLRERVDLRVHCFGAARDERGVRAHPVPAGLETANAAIQAMAVDMAMAAAVRGTAVVHSHTWYTNAAGHIAALVHGVPHVVTAHSLEPMRPWKAEQLGGGYAVSSFCERTGLAGADRIIAVSHAMRDDILACHPDIDPARIDVVHNGVDTAEYAPDHGTGELERLGIPLDRPIVACVARITRQKGLPRLLRAVPALRPGTRLVVCASAPDTPEIGAEFADLVAGLNAAGAGVVWLDGQVPPAALRQLLTRAEVFVCPSRYEPLGIVNLEALACGTPVVATATGGIPEVVADGVHGHLVAQDGPDAAYTADLADRVNALLADPGAARAMGAAGRRRVQDEFSWERVAARVEDVYRAAVQDRAARMDRDRRPAPALPGTGR